MYRKSIFVLLLALLPTLACGHSSRLVSAVSNFGAYGDPNFFMPSCQWPYGTPLAFNYLWEGYYWVGAVVNGTRHVSHADYGNYEWHAMGDPLNDNYNVLGFDDFCDTAQYNDFHPEQSHFPMRLEVSQVVTAFPTGQGPDEAFLVQQTLYNADDYQILDSVYIGWAFDYDIANGDTTQCNMDDWASYQPERALGYMWDGDDPETPEEDTGDNGLSPGYAGIALLDAPLPLCSFQWWGWEGYPENDDEKFQYLAGIPPMCSSPFRSDPDSVFDYRVLISTGPYSLAPGDSIYTAFTFAVGSGLDGLNAAVDEMIDYYTLPVRPEPDRPKTVESFQLQGCFPNPFNPTTVISFELPFASLAKFDVYDIARAM